MDETHRLDKKMTSTPEQGDTVRNQENSKTNLRDEVITLLHNTEELYLEKCKNEIKNGVAEDIDKESFVKYLGIIAVEAGITLKNSVNEQNRDSVMAIRRSLVTAMRPQNPAELMLIDLIINAYFRLMMSSKIFSNLILNDGKIVWGDGREGLLKILDRHIERANKQIAHALTTFRALKQAPVKVNIKADSAYLAQAQQFNQNLPGKDAP